MAAPTEAEQKQRLRDILATYSAIGTDVSASVPIVHLPAFEVYSRGATRQPTTSTRRLVTRTLAARVYVAEICDGNDDAQIRAGLDAAGVLIDPLADFLAEHPRLMLLTATAHKGGLVHETGAISDRGVMIASYGTNHTLYGAFDLEIPTTTYR